MFDSLIPNEHAPTDHSEPRPKKYQPFDGDDYVQERDGDRLEAQMERVKAVVSNGAWWRVVDIANITGDPQTSVSAQLRSLRKPKFGGHTVERRYLGDGLYEFRYIPVPSDMRNRTKRVAKPGLVHVLSTPELWPLSTSSFDDEWIDHGFMLQLSDGRFFKFNCDNFSCTPQCDQWAEYEEFEIEGNYVALRVAL